jgi:hypothetical protein
MAQRLARLASSSNSRNGLEVEGRRRDETRFRAARHDVLGREWRREKRMMGLEPTTFCMANRPKRVRLT